MAWLLACVVACARAAPEAEVQRETRPAVPSMQAAPGAPTPTRRLQRWMESELRFRMRINDFRGLERSLAALAAVEPAEFPRWSEIAAAAARAAGDRNLEAVRKGCATCHQQYRARFRAIASDYDMDRLIERSRS